MSQLTEEISINEEDYKAEELANLCRVHVSTVRRWINKGSLTAIRLPGGYYRISAEEVRRLRGRLGDCQRGT